MIERVTTDTLRGNVNPKTNWNSLGIDCLEL